MPYEVRKSAVCPASRPWAVVNQTTQRVEGCHPTEEMAKRHQRALYANVPEARQQGQ